MNKPTNAAPVGIDLGTTYSVVATIDSQGRPRTIQNAEGDITTPSVVMFDRSNVIVGKEAVKLASYEPEAVAAYAKRDIGATRFGKAIRGHHLPPEVVQSFVLRKLKADAELKLGPIQQAVVTVPAYFNEPRRKATQDAGRLANLEVLDIINEPTAAAIAYGVERGFLSGEGEVAKPETVLVYDLGGGTFDVTLMYLDGHDYTALATAGDVYLGGIDWDQRIVDFVAGRFAEENGGLDPRESPSALMRLLREAEDAKRALSAREDVIISFEHEGRFLRVSLSRRHFEMLTSDLLERTRFTTRKLLRESRRQWKDVTRLLLVGGSSRMPQVQQMLRTESSLEPDRSLAADEAVAHGAAIYCNFLLAGKGNAVRSSVVGNITNVASHDLGVLGTEAATGRPRRRIIIPHNSKLPARKRSRFFTQAQGQQTIVVKVVEGGDDSGHNAAVIGLCTVSDLPGDLPKHSAVDVSFRYGENGRLTVTAMLPALQREATMEIERASGLNEDQLKVWMKRIEEGRLMVEPGGPGSVEAEDEIVEAVFEEPKDIAPIEAEEPALESAPADVAENDAAAFPWAASAEPSEPTSDDDDPELGQFLRGLP